MESEKDQKQRFKLFFEYLKRNEQYIHCWEWVTNNFDEERFDLSELKRILIIMKIFYFIG